MSDRPNDEIFSTGQVAVMFDTIEPRISDMIRRNKIRPPPRIESGRRVWTHAHILQISRLLRRPANVAAGRAWGQR